MRVLSESWCFCNGGGKSERLKASIFSSKSAAMARLSSSSPSSSAAATVNSGGGTGDAGSGTGFLIHRSLLLTTHVNLPSVSAAESAEIRLQNGVSATLVPQRFFMTSSILDLTIVGLDSNDADSSSLTGTHQQPHHLKICPKPNLDLGSAVYLLGYTHQKGELTIGEGKVVIATDNLIKLSTDGVTLSPGSAGFDSHGNLAFVVCDPMKLATSPNTNTNTKSSSTSTSSTTSSWKKDLPLQFGIPMPVICDWLNQHWEGSLDELSKPKLPLMRLVSSGHHRSEHFACASFTKRQVFKPSEGGENELTGSSSSNAASKSREQPLRFSGGSGGSPRAGEEDNSNNKPAAADPLHSTPGTTHAQGIPTPEIYESPKVTATPVKKKESPHSLLDINFPPRVGKFAVSPPPPPPPQPANNKGPLRGLNRNPAKEMEKEEVFSSSSSPRKAPVPLLKAKLQQGVKNNMARPAPDHFEGEGVCSVNGEVESTGSVNIDDGAHSEVHSCSSPVQVSEMRDGQNSEVETMYSAETAESRNYTSPREVTHTRFNQQPVGRSQSCVNYNRWAVHKYPVSGRKSSSPLDKQRSFTTPRKTYSSGGGGGAGGASSYRSNEYFSPTVSSIMKKRNNQLEQSHPHPQPPPPGPTPIISSHRARHSAVNSSPRWMF